jgi:polysaccharide biosynthesis transport protein
MARNDLMSSSRSGNDGGDEASGGGMIFPSPLSLLHIIWLRKWVILATWVLVALPIGVMLSIFNLPRSYQVGTVMRFPSVVGAQTNVMRDIAITQGESIIGIFNSFQVLHATVEDLSLRVRIRTPEVFQRDVVQSINYSENLGAGGYTLDLDGAGLAHLKYKPVGGREEISIYQGPLKDGHLVISGLDLEFRPDFLLKARNVRLILECLSDEEAVKSLRESMGIKPLGQSNFQVSLKDNDPFLVADILNALREEFLKVYYGTTEVQNVGVLAQMEKDQELAKQRLEKSQDDVSKFYGSHPELVVQDRQASTSDNLTFLESRQEIDLAQNRKLKVEGAFRAKPVGDQAQERYFWASELLAAMAEGGDSKANILRGRLAEVTNQQNALRAQLGQGHPRLQELEDQRNDLYAQMEQAEAELVRGMDKRISDLRLKMARSAPASAPNIPVKVRLELDRLTSVNSNNQQIYDRVLESYNRAKLVTGSEFFKVAVVDVARPARYTPPSLKARLLIAGVATLFLLLLVPAGYAGYHLVFQRIYTKQDVKRMLNVRLLGSVSQGYVPTPVTVKAKPSTEGSETTSIASDVESLLLFFGKSYKLGDLEAYRLIREETESFFKNPNRPNSLVLLVTSTQPGEGKTLTSSNIALTFARKGKRTLLVDADFRLGRVAKVFNAKPSTGLDEMLSQEDLSMEEFLGAASLCFVPSLQNGLVLVPRKVNNPNAGEMVSSDRFKAFIRMAISQFDVVIIDTPPMMITPEPLSLAELVDGVIFVTRSGLTPVAPAREALQTLQDRGVRVAVVLNGVHHSPFEDDRYKKYSYYYREGALRPPPNKTAEGKSKTPKRQAKRKKNDTEEKAEEA